MRDAVAGAGTVLRDVSRLELVRVDVEIRDGAPSSFRVRLEAASS